MKYLVMCKVYTDVCGIKQLYHVCPPVRKIIHSLKLVGYLHVQADNPWHNYYLTTSGSYIWYGDTMYAMTSMTTLRAK